MIPWLWRHLSIGGRFGRHQILFFHRVPARRDELQPHEPTPDEFATALAMLARFGTALSLSEAVDRLATGRLPKASFSVTFDDGYRDNYENALPSLERYQIPATVFVATAFLDGGRMWNDNVIEAIRVLPAGRLDLSDLGLGIIELSPEPSGRRPLIGKLLEQLKYLPLPERLAKTQALAKLAGLPAESDLMMTSEQLRDWHRRGMEVGGHTDTHPILARLDDAQARQEILRGRERLTELLGEAPTLFAYPNGKLKQDYTAPHAAMVREAGFKAAFSTHRDVAGPSSDPYQLPRFAPWALTPAKLGLLLLRNRYGLL